MSNDKRSKLTLAGCAIGEDTGPDDVSQLCSTVLSSHGIACQSHVVGATEWVDGHAQDPLMEQSFEDDFVDVAGGWTGRPDLRKRQGVLVVPTDGRRTFIRQTVEWDLSGRKAAPPAVIFEFSSRSVRSVSVTVSGPAGEFSQSALGTGDLSQFRFILVPVDPGTYHQVSIEINPIDRTGRFHLGGIRS